MCDDLISVIIPVYNAEMHIAQCMECIQNQTYKKLEIIFVDDGSDDRSAELCKNYAEQDDRVKYVYKMNGGPASARNAGIKKACGKYIYFLDADDIIEDNAIERLYEIFLSENVDFVIGNAVHINTFGEKCIVGDRKNKLYKDRESVKELVYEFADDIKSHKILWTVWGKLYRSDIIKTNNLCYNEKIDAWEDTMYVIMYLAHCASVSYIGDCLYTCDHYRQSDCTKQSDCASGRMWLGPLDFRYTVREVEKVLNEKRYERVIGNCYSEYAILSMFTSTRLLRINTAHDLRRLYANIYRIVHDRKLQKSIRYYVQKHDDNAKIIPFFVRKKCVWLILITFKLQIRKIAIKRKR